MHSKREPRLSVAYGSTEARVLDRTTCVAVRRHGAPDGRSVLLVSKSVDFEDTFERIEKAAKGLGWRAVTGG